MGKSLFSNIHSFVFDINIYYNHDNSESEFWILYLLESSKNSSTIKNTNIKPTILEFIVELDFLKVINV